MKKLMVLSAVLFAVVVASGPAQATLISLNGVSGATKVWIWDPGKDDKITAVDSTWNYEKLYKRGVKIHGNLSDPLDITLDMVQGDGKLLYAVFNKGKLLEWGKLNLNTGEQTPKPSLNKGRLQTATWRFGGKVNLASVTGAGDINGTNGNNHQVPEPATMLLLGMGLVGVSIYARRRFRTN
jgi:hypothetical protein